MPLWGNTDEESSKPKFIPNAAQPTGDLYFVDNTEAGTQEAKEKGMSIPGWYLYRTYTDVGGNTRHKAELIVVLPTPADEALDAADDAILPDFSIVINTQPANQSVEELLDATFTVVAVSDPAGETLSYQWQVALAASPTVFNNIVGETTDTLVVTTALADDGNLYRCVISATGATTVTSDSAELEVTPA